MQETVNLDIFTPPPGPTLPIIPRPTVATPPTAPTRQISTFFTSEFQNSHLAALRPADFVTPAQIELPQNPTHTALLAPCGPHTTMRLRPRRRLRARAKDRSMDRKPLFLRCDPEQHSTLLWPPAMCNHSYNRQELACYSVAVVTRVFRSTQEKKTRDTGGKAAPPARPLQNSLCYCCCVSHGRIRDRLFEQRGG